MLSYTTIVHEERVKLGLTCNEYVLLDIIYNYIRHNKLDLNKISLSSIRLIGKDIGIIGKSMDALLSGLLKKGFIIEKNYYYTISEKFYNSIY